PEEIRRLARQRWAARLAKDFAESDRLRDRIAAEGYTVKDGKEGYELLKKH
ncbi:MAG: cysteine--tRNA ligase, partial [Planctomycetes bacterium]|nr:cysteine--tRNA ligase [Planctomycetota bacterium]